jgi:2-C-methyl-D-erythritol 2,4-cyclodiphosphate synthase
VNARVGQGFDVHPWSDEPGRALVLGGVVLPGERGLAGHSDADVVAHAVADALLGAAGLGDIGQHFRNDDPQWRGADSSRFVRAVMEMLGARGLVVGNADVTVLGEQPKVGPHREAMRRRVAELLEVPESQVNIKATTTESLGFLGRSEGIAAQAVVLLLDE